VAGVRRCAWPIVAICDDIQFAAERFEVRTRSGFRDGHASKGSNRA
jgi:hypothetical protein